jgi:stress-induced morphogen
MPLSAEHITSMVKTAFPDADIRLEDLAGDNDHWRLTIRSEAFRGLSRVAQHRLVYDALQGKMGGDLHALALVTGLPQAG